MNIDPEYDRVRPASRARGAGGSSLPDHDESVAQPFRADEVEQNGSMLGIQSDATGRRWSAQAGGLGGAMDCVVSIIENRIGHKCIVVPAGPMVPRKPFSGPH